jgi:tetratricopeptide (TPR) repeat protein
LAAVPKLDRAAAQPRARFSTWLLGALGGGALLAFLLVWGSIVILNSPGRMRAKAEAAVLAGDWNTALRSWRAVNATEAARGITHLAEARACLALDLAAQAEQSLRRAIAADPTELEAWRLLLQILRAEDRTLEAQKLGWEGYTQVRPGGRSEVLRELTLALLADVPDEPMRNTLRRWATADPADVNAQVALLARIAAQPRASDPNRPALLASLESTLNAHPEHVGAREALVAALADAGEPDRGRRVLDGWPETDRDARFWRLRGRWELEYEHNPDRAVAPFRNALSELPQDWRSWYRLARALYMIGRHDESRQAAEMVRRVREVLEPLTLGPRLDAVSGHVNDPTALNDLASLCDRAGLTRLADAWRALAQTQVQPAPLLGP